MLLVPREAGRLLERGVRIAGEGDVMRDHHLRIRGVVGLDMARPRSPHEVDVLHLRSGDIGRVDLNEMQDSNELNAIARSL